MVPNRKKEKIDDVRGCALPAPQNEVLSPAQVIEQSELLVKTDPAEKELPQ